MPTLVGGWGLGGSPGLGMGGGIGASFVLGAALVAALGAGSLDEDPSADGTADGSVLSVPAALPPGKLG